MTDDGCIGSRLDEHLKELAAGIVERVALDPPEWKERLRPPKLRVARGPNRINSYCVNAGNGATAILVGTELYPFVCRYTRAAATFFLPSEPDGPRPSPLWPSACSALATTLDWVASPAASPRYPSFELTPRQEKVALAFATYTYRFALCHEMGHVALGHVDGTTMEERSTGDDEGEALRALQDRELEADRFAVDLQIKSLPVRSDFVTALASAMYFIHTLKLLDARLMLLARLVDHEHWKFEKSHPPTLLRVSHLMRAAESSFGLADGLMKVHEGLAPMGEHIWATANQQQEEVAASALHLVREEVDRIKNLPAERAGPSGWDDETCDSGRLADDAVQCLRPLLDRSPLGVLRVLDSLPLDACDGAEADETRLGSRVRARLAAALPPEFQQFLLLSGSARASKLA